MTDLDRLRAHLEAGKDICPTDWNNFHTPDGGKPIMRIAARIKDLRDEGYPVERTGTRNRCAVYNKVSADASSPIHPGADLKTTEASAETLFDLARSPFAVFDEDAA